MRAYIKKLSSSQINNLRMLCEHLEKQEQAKTEISRQKEIIKMGEEIREMEPKQ
jgi:hypothetical protein